VGWIDWSSFLGRTSQTTENITSSSRTFRNTYFIR
jgi:hypothetical protein